MLCACHTHTQVVARMFAMAAPKKWAGYMSTGKDKGDICIALDIHREGLKWHFLQVGCILFAHCFCRAHKWCSRYVSSDPTLGHTAPRNTYLHIRVVFPALLNIFSVQAQVFSIDDKGMQCVCVLWRKDVQRVGGNASPREVFNINKTEKLGGRMHN